jgi:hypothetical protein
LEEVLQVILVLGVEFELQRMGDGRQLLEEAFRKKIILEKIFQQNIWFRSKG